MSPLARCCLAVGVAVGLTLVAACPPTGPIPAGDPACTDGGAIPPGDTIMGVFEFTTQVDPATTCSPEHKDINDTLDGGLSFRLILSRDTISGQAWMTLDGYARCANYSRQTQTFTSYFEAPIPLRSCVGSCKTSRMSERLELVVLSRSQSQQVEDRCDRLDPGVLPEGPGVTPPVPTLNGYDTWRACGKMTVEFNPPDAGCDCTPDAGCKAVYQLEGRRRFQ
jgi:hypothetical protein